MFIDLANFLNNKDFFLPIEGRLESKGIDFGKEVNISEPIKYDGKIHRINGDKLIDVRIHYIYKGNCDRCLKPITNDVSTKLTGRLVEANTGDTITPEKFEEIIYFKNNILNIKDYIVNQVIISLPMKSLCNSDCMGLCPKCGADLNFVNCDCDLDEIDPRLEKLQNFFLKN
ncbi:MAG: DUF177 domain-containing protein [Tissierellaceae bacterium]